MRDYRYPIAAILTPGVIEGRTRVQKYLFLLQERTDFHSWDFVADDYGPYSKQLYLDFDEMVESGFVNEEKRFIDDGDRLMYYYSATDAARELVASGEEKTVNETICFEATKIRNKYDGERLIDVIESIVSQHPRYAANLII